MTSNRGRVLLAGETWVTYGIHQKGFSAYTTGGYEVGSDEFLAALKAKGWDVDHIPNHLATESFPTTVEALDHYDVVILSDVGADTLLLHPDTFVRGERTPNRLAAIDDWVRSGGGFLMIGGYMSFAGFEGKGGYHATPVEDCLPVEIYGYDDRAERPEGFHPRVGGKRPSGRERTIGAVAVFPGLQPANRQIRRQCAASRGRRPVPGRMATRQR
ncbi:MAG: glutamine amidotransferase [Nocardioidaceae bacterium]